MSLIVYKLFNLQIFNHRWILWNTVELSFHFLMAFSYYIWLNLRRMSIFKSTIIPWLKNFLLSLNELLLILYSINIYYILFRLRILYPIKQNFKRTFLILIWMFLNSLLVAKLILLNTGIIIYRTVIFIDLIEAIWSVTLLIWWHQILMIILIHELLDSRNFIILLAFYAILQLLAALWLILWAQFKIWQF